jgi:hypothetical protein
MAEFIPQFSLSRAKPAGATRHNAFRAMVEQAAGGRYGAPMGWSNTPGEALPMRSAAINRTSRKRCNVELFRVEITEGYCPAGYYYGSPADLWEAAADLDGCQPFRFRAANRAAARATVLQYYPAAVFSACESLDDFMAGYLAAAEWLMRDEMDSEGTGDCRDIERRGWTRASLAEAESDCADFIDSNAADLDAYTAETGRGMESAGHDFFLTRNRHGAGFWDRGNGACLRRLTDASHGYGEADSMLLRNGFMRLGY